MTHCSEQCSNYPVCFLSESFLQELRTEESWIAAEDHDVVIMIKSLLKPQEVSQNHWKTLFVSIVNVISRSDLPMSTPMSHQKRHKDPVACFEKYSYFLDQSKTESDSLSHADLMM